MKFLFGLVLCIFVSSGHQVNSDAAIPAKRYKVDLDAPPIKRLLSIFAISKANRHIATMKLNLF